MAVSVYDPYWLRAYTLRPFQVLLALYLVVVCAFITREALRGDIDARIAASGLAAAIATGLYDIAVSFLGLSFILPKVSYLGLLAFIASLGMVMDRRLRVVPAKLLSFSTTREGTDSGAPVGDQQEKKSAPAAITPDIRAKLEQAISYLKEHYTEDVSREGLAALIGMNHDYFGKMFISYTGKKFSSYINELRITKAAGILTTTDQNIVNIAFSVGYESLSTFYRAFQGVTGLSPLAYRERFSNNPPEN
ncbi:MAG TPA: AraC family transcriptional regulator [Spirochaetota bacterium]|nr:AraC family transcriptional regulator [Spirochaetota bacterium]